jgi:molybdopterin-synthase adenylyltransferase
MKSAHHSELRLDRQSFLGEKSDLVLRRSRVGIVGLGSGGSHIAQQLGHLGVGKFVLIDPDIVEDTNLNRLVGATQQDVANRASKVSVAERVIGGVNPSAQIWTGTSQWQMCPAALRSCDVIFGCVDSISEREQLETAARRYVIPYLDLGMDVHWVEDGFVVGGQVALSMPEGPCLRCMGIVDDRSLALEAQMYGAAGGRPQVVWPNGVLAALAVGCSCSSLRLGAKYRTCQSYLSMTVTLRLFCRAGIAIDVIGAGLDLIPQDKVRAILSEFPRLSMKRQFLDCLCGVVRRKPATTYDNTLRDLGTRYVKGYTAPSLADLFENAPFPE